MPGDPQSGGLVSSPFNLANCRGGTSRIVNGGTNRSGSVRFQQESQRPPARPGTCPPPGAWVAAGISPDTPEADDPRVLSCTQSVNQAVQMLNDGLKWPADECLVYSASKEQWCLLSLLLQECRIILHSHAVCPLLCLCQNCHT